MSSQIPMTGIPARQPAPTSMPPPSFRTHAAGASRAEASAPLVAGVASQSPALSTGATAAGHSHSHTKPTSAQAASTASQQLAQLHAQLAAAVQRSKLLESQLHGAETQLVDQELLMHTNMAEAQQREAALKLLAERAKQRQVSLERYQSQQVQEADRAAEGAKRARENREKALRMRISKLEEDNTRLRRSSSGAAHPSQPRSSSRNSQSQPPEQPALLTSSGGVRARRPPSASGISPSPEGPMASGGNFSQTAHSQPAMPRKQWAHLEHLEAAARSSAPAAAGSTPSIIAPSAVRAVVAVVTPSASLPSTAASPPPAAPPGPRSRAAGQQENVEASAIGTSAVQTAVQIAVAHCAPQMLLLLSAADGASSLAEQLAAAPHTEHHQRETETVTYLLDPILSSDGRGAPHQNQHGNMHTAQWLQQVCRAQRASRVDTAFLNTEHTKQHRDGGEPMWCPPVQAGGCSARDVTAALQRLAQPCCEIQALVASADSTHDPHEDIHRLLSCLISLVHLPPLCSALDEQTCAASCLQASVSVAAAQVLCVVCTRSASIMAELLAEPLADLAAVGDVKASPVPPAPPGWDDGREATPPAHAKRARRHRARAAVRSDGSVHTAASSALASSTGTGSLPLLSQPSRSSGDAAAGAAVGLWTQLLHQAPKEHLQHLKSFSPCSVLVVSAWLQVLSHALRSLRQHADSLHGTLVYVLGKSYPCTKAGHMRALSYGLGQAMQGTLLAASPCDHLAAAAAHAGLAGCLLPIQQHMAIAHSSQQAPPPQVVSALYAATASGGSRVDPPLEGSAAGSPPQPEHAAGALCFAPPAWWRVTMLRVAGLPALAALSYSVDALSQALAVRVACSGQALDACFSNCCGALSAWLSVLLPSPHQLMDSADVLPFMRTTWAVWNDMRTEPSHREAQLIPATTSGVPSESRSATNIDSAESKHALHRVEPSSCWEVPLAGVAVQLAQLCSSVQALVRAQPSTVTRVTQGLVSLHGMGGSDFYALTTPQGSSMPQGTLEALLPHAVRLLPRVAWLAVWASHVGQAATTHGHELMVDVCSSRDPPHDLMDLARFSGEVQGAWGLVSRTAADSSRVLSASNNLLATVAAIVPEALLARLQQSHVDLAFMGALAQMDVWGGERGFFDAGGALHPHALRAEHAPSPEGAFDMQGAAAKLFKVEPADASQSDAPLRGAGAAAAEAAAQGGQPGATAAPSTVLAFTPTSIRDQAGHMGWIAVGSGLPALLRLRARYNSELRTAVKGGSS